MCPFVPNSFQPKYMRKQKQRQRFAAYGTAAGILVITFILLALLPDRPEAGDIPPQDTVHEVPVLQFVPGDFPTEIRITGRVRSVQRIELFSEVQGVLQSGARPFRTGNRFRAGEVLLSLDDTEARLELSAQQSRFQSALAALLPAVRLDFPDRFETWAAYTEAITPGQSLPELPEISDRTERFFFAGNDIFGQFFAIRAAEQRLSKFTLTAPFGGELRMADAFPGTLITPGTKLGEFFGDTYELETFVSLSELDFVETGSTVSLRSPAFPEPLEGRITRIGRSIDAATQAFPVFVEVRSPALREGLYLEGRIAGRVLSEVAEIPRHLLTRTNTVMVIEESVATHRSVEPVFFNTETVLVRGLSADDQVIELRAGTTRLAGARVQAAD